MKELKLPVHQPEDAGGTPAHGDSIAVLMFETPIPLVRGPRPKAERGTEKGRTRPHFPCSRQPAGEISASG